MEIKGANSLKIEQAFGLILKKNRINMKLSQEELAHRSNLDRTYISLLERGQRKPTLNTIFVLSANLNIKPSNLIKEVESFMANSTVE
jgi:transcriptional regulator with XRE-family HTH domain